MAVELIAVGISGLTLVSILLIAAAKSIFQTKTDAKMISKEFNAKLYDDKGVTNFVPRPECDKHIETEEKRKDDNQRATCGKIDKLEETVLIGYREITKTQVATGREVANLNGRVEQFLSGEIGRENGELDKLANTVKELVAALEKE